MVNAFTVAEWFIAHNNAVMLYNSADEISNLKIQKLLYYAQGLSLALLDKKLFPEDIVAWKHGPVVESVYQKYHKYGRRGIDDIPSSPNMELEIEILLVNTYNTFAKYSAWELANLTHKEEPWKLTPANHLIPLNLIREYFVKHYKNVEQSKDMADNILLLRDIEKLPDNWDGEEGLRFDHTFIQEVVDLISTLQVQPDLGPTGRGSIQLEYGSRKKNNKYLGIEIYEKDRKVEIYEKDESENRTHEEISMEDINARVQQF